MSDSREQFEQAVEKEWPDDYCFNFSPDGYYRDEILERHWWSWQASRQALEGEPAAYAVYWGHGEVELYESPLPVFGHEPDAVTPLYTHPASAVPEGWKLVPVESSYAMEDAGCGAYMEADGNLWMHYSSMGHAYKAMIDAAPCASQPTESAKKAWKYFQSLMGPDDPARSVSAGRPGLGQRKAAQIGQTIGVLVQNQHGKVCAVTDMGRVTWLPQSVIAPTNQEQSKPAGNPGPLPRCESCGNPLPFHATGCFGQEKIQ